MRKLICALPLLVFILTLPGLHAQQEPVPPAKPDDIVTAMQAIENTWSDALLKHDQFALEGVLSPAFVGISAEGEVTTRNQQIARLFVKDSEDADAISFEQKVATVRVFGDIAVVNGTYILRYARGGRTIDDKGIFSHVFQKTRTRWQCINSQRTFVVEQAAATKKPGVLPFHIPGTRAPAPPSAVPEEQP
jgi:ketosteroid isomerase-like protein